jgi:hypothetical protein
MLTDITITNCQKISFGARVGLNFSSQSWSAPPLPKGNTNSPATRTGFLTGAYVNYKFSDRINIQPELMFSSLGTKSHFRYSDSTLAITEEGQSTLNYLSLPILFRYRIIDKKIHFLFGPQISLLLAAKGKTTSVSIINGRNPVTGSYIYDLKYITNSIDFGGVAGFAYESGRFDAGLRYYFGLSNIAKNVSPYSGIVKNVSFQIVAGYKLFH